MRMWLVLGLFSPQKFSKTFYSKRGRDLLHVYAVWHSWWKVRLSCVPTGHFQLSVFRIEMWH